MEMTVPPRDALLRDYWAQAPFSLAFERSWEGRLFAHRSLARPILDVGCGEGLFASLIFPEPIDTGIDPNGRELERARDLGKYREVLQCTGDRIPKPDGFYQTIFSNSVLEHIPDLHPVIVELNRVLAPGGALYVTVPTDRFDHYSVVHQVLATLGMKERARRYRSFFNRFWHHYHYYQPDGWRRIFEAHGLELQECQTYGPKSLCLLNDFMVPFSLPNLLLKKGLNRWTLFPTLRRLLLTPLAMMANHFGQKATKADKGGLVFLKFKKPVQTTPRSYVA
jgi:SAM-dependent methyltransferase